MGPPAESPGSVAPHVGARLTRIKARPARAPQHGGATLDDAHGSFAHPHHSGPPGSDRPALPPRARRRAARLARETMTTVALTGSIGAAFGADAEAQAAAIADDPDLAMRLHDLGAGPRRPPRRPLAPAPGGPLVRRLRRHRRTRARRRGRACSRPARATRRSARSVVWDPALTRLSAPARRRAARRLRSRSRCRRTGARAAQGRGAHGALAPLRRRLLHDAGDDVPGAALRRGAGDAERRPAHAAALGGLAAQHPGRRFLGGADVPRRLAGPAPAAASAWTCRSRSASPSPSSSAAAPPSRPAACSAPSRTSIR